MRGRDTAMGPCQMFSSVQKPRLPVCGLTRTTAPSSAPIPSSAFRELPRGASQEPPCPQQRERMTSWHMSTAPLMHLPTPSTPLTANPTPSHHWATVSAPTRCLGQRTAHPGPVWGAWHQAEFSLGQRMHHSPPSPSSDDPESLLTWPHLGSHLRRTSARC